MRRTAIAAALLLAALGGCASPGPVDGRRSDRDPFVLAPPGPLAPVTQVESAPRPPGVNLSRRWACDDGTRLTAVPVGTAVDVTIAGRRKRLPRAATPMGTRYAAGKWVFWVRGDEATLFRPAASQARCHRLT